ncbi:MAG: diguanylate cyclase [Magnetovibrio sp.]|nr:diguanylate cyclase [Magnetovibrio sp.]
MRSYGIILVGLFCLLASSDAYALDLNEQDRVYLDQKKHISMCVDPDWMPYESIDKNGQHIGIAADFIALISKEIETPIELVPTTSWQQSLGFAEQKKCDILSLLNQSGERDQFLNYTTPYINAAVVLVAKDDVVYLNSFKALNSQTLAVVQGSVYETHIRKHFPDVHLVYVESLDGALKRVSRGEVFAAVGSLFTASHHIQKLGLSNLKIAGQTDLTHKLRIGVRKDDLQLLSILQKAINNIDPKLRNEVIRNWSSFRFEMDTDNSRLWQISLIVLLGAVFVVYRYLLQRRFNLRLKINNKELQHLPETDQLTGVYNRKKTDMLLRVELERSQRYGRDMSVVMFDLDHFKSINDTYGYQEGDRVLTAVVTMVKGHMRQHDILGRWGGEEFLVLCPETDLQGARELAENLCAEFAKMNFGKIGVVTASFGVAQNTATDDARRLIRRADDALSNAKQSGRNRVCVFKPVLTRADGVQLDEDGPFVA